MPSRITEKRPAEERTLWEGRRSFWNWWLRLMTADLFLLLALALWWAGHGRWSVWAVLAALLAHATVLVQRASSLYAVTSERVIARNGLLSTRTDEVDIRDVRNISVEQSFFQRLLKLGDIGVSSAGSDGVEVVFTGIPEASAVKEIIRRARQVAGDSDE